MELMLINLRATGILIMAVSMIRYIPAVMIKIHAIVVIDVGRLFAFSPVSIVVYPQGQTMVLDEWY